MKEQSFLAPSGRGGAKNKVVREYAEDKDDYEELKVEQLEMNGEADLRGDLFNKKKRGAEATGPKDMNAPELVEELEEFFQSAHDHIVSAIDEKRAASVTG